MKNVTISLDDDSYRRARIKAAERGTSLSGLVRALLDQLGAEDAPSPAGVRDMNMGFTAEPPAKPKLPPRKFGAMKGEIWMADDFDEWPEDMLKAMEGDDPDDPLFK